MTKMQLMAMLFDADHKLFSVNGVTGYIRSIEREDGSGSSFNVMMWNHRTNQTQMIYVKTID